MSEETEEYREAIGAARIARPRDEIRHKKWLALNREQWERSARKQTPVRPETIEALNAWATAHRPDL